MVSLIFAAGIFTGILSETGMVEAMSKEVVGIIPPALGPYMAPITAMISLPATFYISNDAFYFRSWPKQARITVSHQRRSPAHR